MKLVATLFFFLSINFCLSGQQDIDAHSPHPHGGSQQQKKAEEKKIAQQKELSKAIEKGRKRQMKIQSKNTKRMMKNSKSKSKKWNQVHH
jgi:hypothetical protein